MEVRLSGVAIQKERQPDRRRAGPAPDAAGRRGCCLRVLQRDASGSGCARNGTVEMRQHRRDNEMMRHKKTAN